jgi:hypothetical protein
VGVPPERGGPRAVKVTELLTAERIVCESWARPMSAIIESGWDQLHERWLAAYERLDMLKCVAEERDVPVEMLE